MNRSLSMRNLYDQAFKYMPLDGIWADVLGKQTREGIWLVYGAEKNGKTTFSLMLANYLSTIERVLYISAEEGVGHTFVDACRRADITYDNKNVHFLEYTPVDELRERLKANKSERIVFIDNLFVYRREITDEILVLLRREHPNTLFIFIAHEDKNEPYPANAESCRKLSKVIFNVRGMAVDVSGRCNGGMIVIDPEQAALYHGSQINMNQNKEV